VPLYDDTTVNVNTGHFYTADVGTAYDADIDPLDWTEIGHTSADNILAITSEGGETTTLATLQAKAHRTTTTPRIDKITFDLLQFDAEALKLYYGSNAVVETTGPGTGLMGVPDDPEPTVCAFLVVLIDGTRKFAFYAPKVEIIRGDDLSMADTSSLSSLPLSVTPLNYESATKKYYILPVAHTP
jgi:hypothetical protein